MTAYALDTLASSVAIGLGQIGIAWYGIRAVDRATEERSRDRRHHAQTLDTLIRQSDASTTAFRTLIERACPGAAS